MKNHVGEVWQFGHFLVMIVAQNGKVATMLVLDTEASGDTFRVEWSWPKRCRVM